MSKIIPYTFDTPIPDYFRKNGYLPLDDDKRYLKNSKFLAWAFSKCKPYPHEEFFDGKMIKLDAYEFICGRGKSSADAGLTEGEFRNQLKMHENAKNIQKTTNSVTNRFTCYKWLTSRFCKNNNQLNAGQATNKQPTEQPQTRSKIVRLEDQLQEPEKVVVFSCLENENLTPEEKLKLMEFSEERIKLALEFSKLEPATKTLYAQLRWHCKEVIPPIAKKSLLTPQQQEATNYNEHVKGKYYEKNKEKIINHCFMLFIDGHYQSISLKSDINVVKNDLNQSKKELNKMKNGVI